MPNFTGISVYPWEQEHAPISLTKLNSLSAVGLNALMNEVRNNFAATNVLVSDTIIIWVVDEIGDIWFAIEEMFHDGAPTGLPKFQDFEPTRGIRKLGHPSLISAGNGRIGGEIDFCNTTSPPIWMINNRSGRYGRHETRTLRHLRNAANEFRSYGIELEIES